MAYCVVDCVWVAAQPDCVPSLPRVILFHHAATAVLLYFPLRYPELGVFTCLDGVTEINTAFLIARRHWRGAARLFNFLYWTTFVAMRLVLYPALLPVFYARMRGHAPWERAAVCGAQAVLVAFNLTLLALSAVNWRRRAARLAAAAAAGRGAATVAPAPAAAPAPLTELGAAAAKRRAAARAAGKTGAAADGPTVLLRATAGVA
eukprot:scaffold22.g6037.t1